MLVSAVEQIAGFSSDRFIKQTAKLRDSPAREQHQTGWRRAVVARAQSSERKPHLWPRRPQWNLNLAALVVTQQPGPTFKGQNAQTTLAARRSALFGLHHRTLCFILPFASTGCCVMMHIQNNHLKITTTVLILTAWNTLQLLLMQAVAQRPAATNTDQALAPSGCTHTFMLASSPLVRSRDEVGHLPQRQHPGHSDVLHEAPGPLELSSVCSSWRAGQRYSWVCLWFPPLLEEKGCFRPRFLAATELIGALPPCFSSQHQHLLHVPTSDLLLCGEGGRSNPLNLLLNCLVEHILSPYYSCC